LLGFGASVNDDFGARIDPQRRVAVEIACWIWPFSIVLSPLSAADRPSINQRSNGAARA